MGSNANCTRSTTSRRPHLARADVFGYIERFYTAVQRYSTVGYGSPVEFERTAGFTEPASITSSSSESVPTLRSSGLVDMASCALRIKRQNRPSESWQAYRVVA